MQPLNGNFIKELCILFRCSFPFPFLFTFLIMSISNPHRLIKNFRISQRSQDFPYDLPITFTLCKEILCFHFLHFYNYFGMLKIFDANGNIFFHKLIKLLNVAPILMQKCAIAFSFPILSRK